MDKDKAGSRIKELAQQRGDKLLLEGRDTAFWIYKDMNKYVKTFEQFDSSDSIVNQIKTALLSDILYHPDVLQEEFGGDYELAWEQFVDQQVIGDCQSIASSVALLIEQNKWTNVVTHFGEIEIDNLYIDEDGDEQTLMTHHWVTIDGDIYEFSKGTLSDYIDWVNLYSVDCEDDSRYNQL